MGFAISLDLFKKLSPEQMADYILWYSEELDERPFKRLQTYKGFLHPSVYRSMHILLTKGKLNVTWDVVAKMAETDKDTQPELWNLFKGSMKEQEWTVNEFIKANIQNG